MELFGTKKDKAMEAYEEPVFAAEEEAEADAPAEETKQRTPWATWEVAGKEYKLKLPTAEIKELEKKYKTNLMNIMGSGEGGMPALSVMLDITQAAMKKYHHGVKIADVDALFDKYLDEGGSQLSFYTSVYMSIFVASGFFSTSLADQMQDSLEEAKNIM